MMQQVKSIYDSALEGLSGTDFSKTGNELAQAGADAAKSGFNAAIDAARKHPGTTAAVVVGTGLAAAALWVLREPQRLAAIKRGISARIRSMLPNERPARGRSTRRKLP